MILYHINRGPVLNFMQPPQEEPPVEYESLLLPPERPRKTRSRESGRRRRRRAEEAENQSPPGNNGEDPIEEYRQHRKRKGRCECCYKHSIFADSPPKGGPPDGGLHRTNLKCSFTPQVALGNAAHSKTYYVPK